MGSAARPSPGTPQGKGRGGSLLGWFSRDEKLTACSTGRLGDPPGRSTWIQIAQKGSKEDSSLVEGCPHGVKHRDALSSQHPISPGCSRVTPSSMEQDTVTSSVCSESVPPLHEPWGEPTRSAPGVLQRLHKPRVPPGCCCPFIVYLLSSN